MTDDIHLPTLMSEINLSLVPVAILRRLATGWTTPEAICAIIDNALDARARNVWVYIHEQEEGNADNCLKNVAAYEIIDDGIGMDPAGMAAALSLASNDPAAYSAHSLAKFGLGLKGAAFSQGACLELVSSRGDEAPFQKRVVCLDNGTPDAYFATTKALSDRDHEVIASHLIHGRGTIVRIADIKKNSHASAQATVREMLRTAGIIYYYFLSDGHALTIQNTPVPPVDVLATAIADEHDPLNENEWDGRTARWIKRPGTPLLLDAAHGVAATVEVTQVPHASRFDFSTSSGRSAASEHNDTGENDHGYYVYRNRRLIAWAEGFDGIVPQDRGLCSFRGRILLDESADEAFNIDFKKARLTLSDEAHETLRTLTLQYSAQSKRAWRTAEAAFMRQVGMEPNQVSNQLADDFEPPFLPEEATRRGRL